MVVTQGAVRAAHRRARRPGRDDRQPESRQGARRQVRAPRRCASGRSSSPSASRRTPSSSSRTPSTTTPPRSTSTRSTYRIITDAEHPRRQPALRRRPGRRHPVGPGRPGAEEGAYLQVLQSQSLGYQGVTFNVGNSDGVGNPLKHDRPPRRRTRASGRRSSSPSTAPAWSRSIFNDFNTVACSPISPDRASSPPMRCRSARRTTPRRPSSCSRRPASPRRSRSRCSPPTTPTACAWPRRCSRWSRRAASTSRSSRWSTRRCSTSRTAATSTCCSSAGRAGSTPTPTSPTSSAPVAARTSPATATRPWTRCSTRPARRNDLAAAQGPLRPGRRPSCTRTTRWSTSTASATSPASPTTVKGVQVFPDGVVRLGLRRLGEVAGVRRYLLNRGLAVAGHAGAGHGGRLPRGAGPARGPGPRPRG